MTVFESGYKAFLDGKDATDNPFDREKTPWSLAKWLEGWSKAKLDKMRAAR